MGVKLKGGLGPHFQLWLTRVTISYVGGQNCQKGPKIMIFAIFEHFGASKLPKKGQFVQKNYYIGYFILF